MPTALWSRERAVAAAEPKVNKCRRGSKVRDADKALYCELPFGRTVLSFGRAVLLPHPDQAYLINTSKPSPADNQPKRAKT
jgi:hypothetical protein